MIWGKRRFRYAEFAPYQDRLEKLLMANAGRHNEFIMVSTKTETPADCDYYIGLPDQRLLAAFDGFAVVDTKDLPNEIDTLLIADATSEPFKSLFRFRARR